MEAKETGGEYRPQRTILHQIFQNVEQCGEMGGARWNMNGVQNAHGRLLGFRGAMTIASIPSLMPRHSRPSKGGQLRAKNLASAAIALAFVLGGLSVTSITRGQDLNAVPPNCNRACLVEFMNKYLAALVGHDSTRVPWADRVEFTENNARLMIGDGSWAVASGKVDNDLIVADSLTGQVGYFGTIELNGLPTWFAARIKVADAKVTELETVWRPRPVVVNAAAPEAVTPRI